MSSISELDKAIEVCKNINFDTIDGFKNYYDEEKQALETVVSAIEQLRDKVNRDIEDGNFVRHGIKQNGKDGSTYYKLTAKEYAKEILGI